MDYISIFIQGKTVRGFKFVINSNNNNKIKYIKLVLIKFFINHLK